MMETWPSSSARKFLRDLTDITTQLALKSKATSLSKFSWYRWSYFLFSWSVSPIGYNEGVCSLFNPATASSNCVPPTLPNSIWILFLLFQSHDSARNVTSCYQLLIFLALFLTQNNIIFMFLIQYYSSSRYK